jgi:hypothetical protein
MYPPPHIEYRQDPLSRGQSGPTDPLSIGQSGPTALKNTHTYAHARTHTHTHAHGLAVALWTLESGIRSLLPLH